MKKKFTFFLITYLFSLAASYGQDVCPGTPFQITSGVPYTQDFESWTTDCSNLDAAGDIPDAHWANSNQSTLTNSMQGWRISTYSAWTSGFVGFSPYPSGTHSARFKTASTLGTVAGYMDLYLDCSASPGTQQLTFNYLNSNSSTPVNYDSLRIMLSTDGVNFTQLGSTYTQTSGWVLETLTFSSSTATTIIRFVGTSYSGQNGSSDIGLDEVTVGTLNTCSGTPAATSLVPAGTVNLSSCSPTQVFSLTTNYSTTSGIAYQWQQSTDGVTFTPISGATDATYTGSFSATGYINCVVTCTTSNQSVTSGTDTINLSAQGYATLPYIQDFDNTWVSSCGSVDADAPDAYWANSLPNALGSSGYGWRNSNYASWTIGLVNFAPYPSGNNSARYHTDGAGSVGSGNLDLYLDCSIGGSSKQATFDYLNDGGADQVTVYLSTNGAAGPFTLLNTYTTATNWTSEVLPFTSNSATTILRFTGSLGSGNGSSDMGLDNLDIATLVDCSGAPTAGTASPSNTSLSPCNASQTFTIAGYDGIIGLTYQWQQSTDGVNFTAISGETNTSYTGTFSVGTTYINCLVTCTNSGSSTPSNVDTVTVSQQSYVAVTAGNPYTQGFENQWINKCGTDDAPDNYWINTPATGNDSWRRNDDPPSVNSAAWTLPSGGSYSPGGSDANGASSTYSARFHSYDATAASTGNFDLYLDLSATGDKQVSYDYINTTGADSLSVLLSTTGPAGPFTRLDGVITSANWATRTFTTSVTSSTCVLRFMGTSDFGNNDMGLDNVSVIILGSCAGTPAAVTVTPSSTISLTACSPNQTFSLSSGNVGISGITYQWQQSTDGVTYSPISGATNLTYTGGFLSGTTYLNCLVTCANSGLSVTSDTDTVNVTPQPAATLPYVQNFDDVWADHCGTDNDAPDSNWINSQPNVLISGETSWRRSDYSLWNEVTEYQPCPTGNYCAMFRTGSTNANSGPASQSMDLYIDCSTSPGTQQLTFYYNNIGGNTNGNQDNLTVSYSTNGAAGPFTQLANYNGTTAWTPDTLTFASTAATTIIRFTGNAVFGSNNSDVAIDAVSVATLSNCTGTPTAATTSPSSAALSSCNPSQTLTLSGDYSGIGGLTYQWQQSTDGVTFTPISGATNGTYTQAFPTGVTYINNVVTCTNSGLSTTSNVDTITVAAQAYAAVATGNPYIQDFEGQWISKCGTDDVPDNYWINSPVTGNVSWRRNDDGASASWNGVNGGMYSPAGSDANGASSTYSARFHGDYVNNIAGADFDLYLDLSAAGTKQVSYDYIDNSTTKGLGVYLSTTGPAGPFTQVDTVLTSTSWTTRTFTTTATGSQCVLRFAPAGDYSHDMGLDNVSVSILSACSGTPTAGTVSPSGPISLTACNPNQAFVLSANNTGISGITYQWQQSTDGVTYTPISGATNLTYNGVFGNGVTYINCLVTCTNSALSAISDTDTVTLTPQSYVAVTQSSPYIQDFENQWINKCGTDDAPDNYWINTPVTGNDSWRRSDDGTSASWNLPNGGGYTPTGSNANGASSSYSARFHSYEGAAGTSGTFDLYLDLSAAGTKQVSYDYINTAGVDSVSVLLSTTGPAGPFTRLDGVITSGSWATHTFTTDATSSNCVLRFMGVADFGNSDIGLDNIAVTVLTPCTGTPNASTISPANAVNLSACNPNQTFTLSASNTGITGLTYQWEQSLDGVTYSPITGATNMIYSGTFNSSDTIYLNCIITCTASGLSTTSNTDTITVTTQSYASIPYIQDFESWVSVCGTDNEAPDVDWVNGIVTPLTSGMAGWRQSDYTTWTVGANTFSPYPSGNYSARFHTDGASSSSVNLDLYVNCSTIPGNKLMSFYYLNTAGSDNVGVYLSVDSGATFTLLNNYTTTSGWTADTLAIASVSPKTIIRFTGTAISGSNGSSDIGLDLVQIFACGGSTVLTATGPLSFCPGDSVILSPDTVTSGNTYQWLQNGGVINGATSNVYTAGQSGVYTVVVNGSGSCPDTTFADTVTVFAPIIPPISEQGNQYLSTTPYATYQWYLNGQPINGATLQVDTPAVNGIYYVVVTDSNGCSGQSPTLTITDLGISSIGNGLQGVSMYPDPNTGNFIVRGELSNVDTKQVLFEVTNVVGQAVYKVDKTLRSGAWETQVSLGNEIANGVYLLHVTADGQSQVIKFIVSR